MKKRLLEICCLCAALALFYEHLPGLWYGSKSENWVRVTGKIENVCIGTCGKSSCSLAISYSYYIEGKRYLGDKVHAEQRNSFYPRQAAGYYERYKSMPEIFVYYDPNFKSRACLIPGYTNIMYYAYSLLGIFFLIGSVYLFFEKVRQK